MRLFGNAGPGRVVPTDDEDAGYTAAMPAAQVQSAKQRKAQCRVLTTIDLNVSHADYPIELSGNLVKFISSGNAGDVLKFRFATADGDQSNDPFPLFPGEAIRFPFDRLLLSNAVQPAPAGGSNMATLAVFLDPGTGGDHQIGFE